MADTTIFNLTATTATAAGDLLPIVDVSDTAQSANGSTRKITYANFLAGITSLGNLVTVQGHTLTLTGAFVRSGAHSLTLTTTGTTNVTLPTTGTLATLAGAESLSNKTLVAPALGTPASGTLTNCTGLPIATGVSGLGSNVASFLATPSSANLRAAVTDEAGTGALAFTNAAVTLSGATNLDAATHGSRLLICDTAATHVILDDTAGSWGDSATVYGINTSAGNVVIAADSTGTTNTVTAEPGMTLTVPAGASFSFIRTAANVWRGGASAAADSDITTLAGLTATTDNFIQSKSSAWASRTVAQVTTDLQGTGSAVDTVGFRGLPQNSQSAAYTTVLADAGKHLYHPGADTTARTFTIDSNANVAYPIGTTLTFVNDTSAGVVTIAITADTMILAGAGTTGSRTLAANGIATAVKMTSTRWMINGTGLT